MAVSRGVRFWVTGALLAVLLAAVLLGGWAFRVALADTDDTGVSAQPLLPWGNATRNIIEGGHVTVCTHEYASATEAAAAMWNDHLRASKGFLSTPGDAHAAFMNRDAFRFADLCPAQLALTADLDAHYSAHAFGYPKQYAEFWSALSACDPYDPSRTLFIDDDVGVLGAARESGVEQLLCVAQPDSQAPKRLALPFPALDDFEEIMPF